VYAEIGKTKEAREILIQAWDLLNLDEPNPLLVTGSGGLPNNTGESELRTSELQSV